MRKQPKAKAAEAGYRARHRVGTTEDHIKLKTKKYDVASYLDSDEMIAAYLDAAFESGDTSRIAEALGDPARARGMTKIARATGLAREQLYKTLSAKGKPELSTVLKVIAVFGGGLPSSFPTPAADALLSARSPLPAAPSPATLRSRQLNAALLHNCKRNLSRNPFRYPSHIDGPTYQHAYRT